MATLTDLILSSRQKADMVNSTFIDDPEWTDYINNSYAELYDILVSRFEDYYSKISTFTITAPNNSTTLPADFYKVRGLDYQLSGNDWVSVRKYNFQDRNKINRAVLRPLYGIADRSYRVMGQSVNILPADRAPGSYQMFYIPRYTPLVNPTDVLGDVLDYQEYITTDAAIKALTKEESDVSVQVMQKNALKERIEAMASNRDTEPERITDVRGNRDRDFWPWG